MRQLIKDLVPHAPQVGLYVAPNIPSDKLQNALDDFAGGTTASEVEALYDATLMRNAKDGAVFTEDRVIFQNNDLEPVHDVRYADIVGVKSRRKLLGGRRVIVTVNRGRATFDLEMDFSGRPKAASYVARFLKEVMLHDDEDVVPSAEASEGGGKVADQPGRGSESTDLETVRAALDDLHASGNLSREDLEAMLRAIGAE